MQRNHVHQPRNPRGQHPWELYENQVIRQCRGKLPDEQIANILTFLGIKRSVKSLRRHAAAIGWTLRETK